MATNLTNPTIPELVPFELQHGKDPIPPEDPNAPFSVEDQHRKKLYEAYQELKLCGFTVSELTDYGCWDRPNATRNNLANPIHPLFQLPKWAQGDEKIGDGYAGNWEMRNPIIWDVMQPVLRLATQMFQRASILPFVDALLATGWRKVPDFQVKDNCPPGWPTYQAYSFQPRPPTIINIGAKFLATQLTKIEQYVQLRFITDENKSKNTFTLGIHEPDCSIEGAGWNPVYIGSIVGLTTEIILPLLRNLTVTERLVQEFGVAKTLVHETMHLVGSYSAHIQQLPFPSAEPFFMNDEISEVGRAWEVSFFGGMLQTTNEDIIHRPGEPFLGFQLSDWPNWEVYDNGNYNQNRKRQRFRTTKVFERGGQRATYISWPIQLIYFESIQQESFWGSCVPKFGDNLFKPAAIMGITRVRQGRSNKVVGAAALQLLSNGKLVAEPAELPQNAGKADIWYREQLQVAREAALQIALRENKTAKERKEEEEREKADPGQRARREEKDRLEEERETKMLEAAFKVYIAEDEEPSRTLYRSIRGSRFARVRAEYFLVYGAFETGETENDREWRAKMRRLASQEFALIRGHPAIPDILARKDEIKARRKNNNEKKRKAKIGDAAAPEANASKKKKT